MGAASLSIDDPRNNRVMVIQVNSRNTSTAGLEIVIKKYQYGIKDWYQVELWSEDCFDRALPNRFLSVHSAAVRGLDILLREYQP